jgi:hypothetical protein
MDEDTCEPKQPTAAVASQAAASTVFLEQKLASRLLLFCLLFEEMQLPCAKIVNTSNLLDKLVSMLEMVTVVGVKDRGYSKRTSFVVLLFCEVPNYSFGLSVRP